jgi:Holliday junction resolvase RusA-like endonuclease
VILGPPATKKNSLRIVTRKSDGRSFVMPSLSAKGWEKTAVEQLRTQFVRGVPIDQAVRMDAVIYRQRATGDLLNYLAAVSDALERAGVIVNDKQIIRLDGCRLEKDAANPRVEVDVIVI